MAEIVGGADGQGGDSSDQATTTDLIAAKTAGTRVGTANVDLSFFYNGSLLNIQAQDCFIAEPGLVAAMQVAGVDVTWSA